MDTFLNVPNRLMGKSEAAFRMSAHKFYQQTWKVYFWTFTCKEVHPDWCYSEIWRRFNLDLQNLYGGLLAGLKVIEFHDNHGIHWHALLNQRMYAPIVRRIGKRYGIGRVHVRKKPADEGAIGYLADYLTEDFKRTNPLYCRASRWGTVGRFKGTRVRDIEVTGSRLQEQIGWVKEMIHMEQLPYRLFQRLSENPFLERADVARLCLLVIPKSKLSYERIHTLSDACNAERRVYRAGTADNSDTRCYGAWEH